MAKHKSGELGCPATALILKSGLLVSSTGLFGRSTDISKSKQFASLKFVDGLIQEKSGIFLAMDQSKM